MAKCRCAMATEDDARLIALGKAVEAMTRGAELNRGGMSGFWYYTAADGNEQRKGLTPAEALGIDAATEKGEARREARLCERLRQLATC